MSVVNALGAWTAEEVSAFEIIVAVEVTCSTTESDGVKASPFILPGHPDFHTPESVGEPFDA